MTRFPDPRIAAIWAKQGGLPERYPLLLHLLDSAAASRALSREWLRDGLRQRFREEMGDRFEDIIAAVAALHDLGKANPVFAGQIRARAPEDWHAEVRAELDRSRLPIPDRRLLALVPEPGHGSRSLLDRHEQVSAWALDTDPKDDQRPRGWMDRFNRNVAAEEWLPLSALGHHGRYDLNFPTQVAEDFTASYTGPWRESRRDLRQMVLEALELEESDLPRSASPTVTVLLTGMTIIADRLASATSRVRAAQDSMSRGELDPTDGAAWIRDRYGTMAAAVRSELGVHEALPDGVSAILGAHAPRPLQTRAGTIGPGLWTVMMPTGSGKTEAAMLRHLECDRERLIFLLPTQATTNSLWRRVQGYYGTASTVGSLVHGMAAIEDFYNPAATESGGEDEDRPRGLFPTDFVSSGAARLLAPVCVGTVDQAAMASLNLKWTPLRLLALANAHVVIDEAHALDPYQSVLVSRLLWWLGETGTRVTLLSATMPTRQRDTFADAYSHADDETVEWTDRPGGGEPTERPAVEFPSWNLTPHASGAIDGIEEVIEAESMAPYRIDLSLTSTDEAVDAHLAWHARARRSFPAARLGIVVNVVDRAVQVARRLQERGEHVVVLHSRMTAEHRRLVVEDLERQLGPAGSGRRLTVVGTQAIEASLDIDLDMLSTDLAPAPSLIQRAGRAWRRADPERAERVPGIASLPMHIVRVPGFGGALPYLVAPLRRAWNHLKGRQTLHVPTDVQEFVETASASLDVFEAEADEERFLEDARELAELSRHLTAGEQAAIDWAYVLDPEVECGRFRTFGSAVSLEGDDTLATRLIDRESLRCVLIGDPASIPGAWTEDLASLHRVRASQKERLRAAMSASLSLSTTRLVRQVRRHGVELDSEAGLLRGVVALDEGSLEESGLGYHPVYGLHQIA